MVEHSPKILAMEEKATTSTTVYQTMLAETGTRHAAIQTHASSFSPTFLHPYNMYPFV